tara:strand:+ start:6445 stop:8409 length:1965 start_codon:yes stop_codon:yes gene_type:complete
MALIKLKFKPGINREVTPYAGENGWFDGDKIRFRFGNVEKIGGWTKKSSDFGFLNKARKIFPWTDLAYERLLGIGTSSKVYIQKASKIYDITPVRATQAAGGSAVTFAKDGTTSTITVTDTAHGAFTGDFVTFSGAASLGGVITADVLNQEYEVTKTSANNYQITARSASTTIPSITQNGVLAPVEVNANSSDTGNGGTSVQAVYQNTSALNVSVVDLGFNAGEWNGSTRAWDSAADISGAEAALRVWSMDNFGEDLIFCAKNGGIFYWDTSANKASMARAVNLTAYNSNADGQTPQVATLILVSDVDRHVIAFGCGAGASPAVQDPLLIRFSHQEDPIQWTETASNSAGELRVGSGNFIVTAVQTKQEILVFTDKSLHSMQFIGPPLTFGIKIVSENITVSGATGVVSIDDSVYWMGNEEFYMYEGSVNRIPCTVRDYVFDDFEISQRELVVAGSNVAFGEVWWFYPSQGSLKNDKYVIYNYEEKVWYYGDLERDSWIDRGLFSTPLAAKDGRLYEHESGFDDNSTTPPTGITSFIESADLDLQEGDNFFFMNRIIPDISFRDSTNNSATANFIIKSKAYPGNNYNDSGSLTTSTDVNKDENAQFQYGVDSYTEEVDVRIRGRSFAFRLQTTEDGVSWRLGAPRVDVQPDGRK